MAKQKPTQTDQPTHPKKLKPSSALKRKFDLLSKLEAAGTPRDPRKCIRTMGQHDDGTVRYCERWAIAGGTVCPKHGGNTKQAKRAAQERMLSLLDRKVERLNEISEQNVHLPSALGATQSFINRVMGKVGDAPKKEGSGTTIQVGISLSGNNPQIASVGVAQLPTGDDTDVIDAETTDEDDA